MENTALLAKAAVANMDTVANEAPPHGTIITSYMGLMGTMAGAAILTLPSTVAMANVVPSIMLFVFLAILSYMSCVCLCIAAEATGEYSYESLSYRLLDTPKVWFVRILTMLLLFGAVVMYMVIAMDMISPFTATYLSRSAIGGIFTLICLPLCLPDTIYALRYSNTMVVVCVMVIVGIIFEKTIQQGSWPEDDLRYSSFVATSFSGIAYSIPIQALSFCCHLNVTRVYGELIRKSDMKIVNILLMGSGFLFYITFSIMGYLCFDGNPPNDILTGFSTNDPIINGVKVSLALCMLFKTPITFQPFREMMEIFIITEKHQNYPSNYRNQLKFRFRTISTSIFLIAAYILAITANNLSYVMDLLGATAGILLSFTVPGLFLLEVSKGYLDEERSMTYRAMAGFLIVVGIVLCGISFWYIVCSNT